MPGPQSYEDIRDSLNRKWTCEIDTGGGFYKGVDISRNTLAISYNCLEEMMGHEIRVETEIDLSQYPKLKDEIYRQIVRTINESV